MRATETGVSGRGKPLIRRGFRGSGRSATTTAPYLGTPAPENGNFCAGRGRRRSKSLAKRKIPLLPCLLRPFGGAGP
jgi:hypothetical protein